MEHKFVSNEVSSFPSADVGVIMETTREWYYHILNAVPPLEHGFTYFVCGEPHDHINGVPVHLAMFVSNKRYFASFVKADSNLHNTLHAIIKTAV